VPTDGVRISVSARRVPRASTFFLHASLSLFLLPSSMCAALLVALRNTCSLSVCYRLSPFLPGLCPDVLCVMAVSNLGIKHGLMKSLCNSTDLSVGRMSLTHYSGVTLTGHFVALSTSLYGHDVAVAIFVPVLSCIRM